MRVVFDQEKHRSEELVSKRWGVLGVGIAYWKVIINMNVRVSGDKDFGNTCWMALSCPRCSFLLLCLNLSSYLCFCHWKKCPRANACLYVCVHIYSWLPAFPSLGNWWFSKVFQSTAVWDTLCFLSVHPRGASFFEPPFLVLLVGLACGWVWGVLEMGSLMLAVLKLRKMVWFQVWLCFSERRKLISLSFISIGLFY